MTEKDRDKSISQKNTRPQYQKPEIVDFDKFAAVDGWCSHAGLYAEMSNSTNLSE